MLRFNIFLKLIILRLRRFRFSEKTTKTQKMEFRSGGRVAERTSSRLRRTNDRSLLNVDEDHEDDENAENGVPLHAMVSIST